MAADKACCGAMRKAAGLGISAAAAPPTKRKMRSKAAEMGVLEGRAAAGAAKDGEEPSAESGIG